jgi:hypothetical protein
MNGIAIVKELRTMGLVSVTFVLGACMTEIPFILHHFFKHGLFLYILLCSMFFSRKIHQKKRREH